MDFPDGEQSDGLLLHSLLCFREIIRDILTPARPQGIREIGVEKALFARFLIEHCARSTCGYTGIDPAIHDVLIEKLSGQRVRSLKERSIEALMNLAPHDVYSIHGDHNYYTVQAELRSIMRHQGNRPLIFVVSVRGTPSFQESSPVAVSLPPWRNLPDERTTGYMGDSQDMKRESISGVRFRGVSAL